jgi:UDP-hydrolysing UDP-N-acetyl-D-glucosamine 2-epimerase
MAAHGKRRICVVTGSRAEYGLLYWLLKELQADHDVELKLAVTGMHLSTEFGNTYHHIVSDGFEIDWKVDMVLSSDSEAALAKSTGLGVMGFSDAFRHLQPDVIVILGDRFEILAACLAAMLMRIPIAHIHGGEITEGAIDESIRHSITKMSQIHFAAAEEYKQRIVQMGELPDHVFNVGAPGLEHIKKLTLLSKSELANCLGFSFKSKVLLVTYHPETLSDLSAEYQAQELLSALEELDELSFIITKANSDHGGRAVNAMMDQFAGRHPHRAYISTSLGQVNYLSAMKAVDAVVGNSSSGIIEAPFMGKPVVNIGNRQKGRLKSEAIIDCPCSRDQIIASIKTAVSNEWQAHASQAKSLYGSGDASRRMKDILKTLDLKKIVHKPFFDIPMKRLLT